MSVKINIHQIREYKSGQVAGKFSIAPRDLELPPPREIWRPFSFEYTCTNAGDLYVLTGKLTSSVALECSRCLLPVLAPLAAEVFEKFSRQPGATSDDILPFSGDEIELAGVLSETIVVNLPVKPLCSPDCRGLCPICGADLNQSVCDCRPHAGDPRLAVLEKLISK